MGFTKGLWGIEYSEANKAYEIAPIKNGALDWQKQICITVDDNIYNANLISAAPELYEALMITRGQWIHSVNAEQCLKALAKAEGKESK